MPFIDVKTNQKMDDKVKEVIKAELGQAIKTIPGKSETWLMVNLEPECSLYFQGSDEPAVFVDIKIYGHASSDSYNQLTKKITSLLSQKLNVREDRIYVCYMETENWGFAGENF